MNEFAIKVENLGKLYRIGTQQERTNAGNIVLIRRPSADAFKFQRSTLPRTRGELWQHFI
jgi:hypothetical protein